MSMFTYKEYANGETLVYDSATKKFIGGVGGGDGGTVTGPRMATYEIYKDPDSGNYYSLNSDGSIFDGPDSTPDAVFQNTLSALTSDYESIYVHNGTYAFSGSFTGLTWAPRYQTLWLAPKADLKCQNGFTGTILTINPTAAAASTNAQLLGGQFSESGSAVRSWTGLKLDVPSAGTGDGISEFYMHNTEMRNPSIAIELKIQRTDGWINAAIFDGIKVRTWTNCAVNFNATVTPTPIGDSKGFNRNVFSNCTFQADPAVGSQTGIKNVKHQRNVFQNCQVWDMPDGQFEIDITADADQTLIIGGRCTHKAWRNLSPSTIILDQDEQVTGVFSKDSRQWGSLDINDTTGGLNLLKSVSNTGTPTISMGTTFGGRRYATTSTINTTVGFRTTNNPFRVTYYPAMRAKIHFLESAQSRIFIGWTTLATLVTTDTSLNSTYSLGFMWRPSDTNWQIVWNDNQASATFTDTTLAKAAAITTFKMWLLSTTRIRYRLGKTEVEGADKQRGHTISDLSGQNLAFQVSLTNTEAVDKRMTVGSLEVYAGSNIT